MYNDKINIKSSIKYQKSDVNELDKDRILCQIQKTGKTFFYMKQVDVDVEHLRVPVSVLNQLRRDALEKFEKALENSILRENGKEIVLEVPAKQKFQGKKPKVNLYLQKFDSQMDYSALNYHEIYVPFKDLIKGKEMRDCIAVLPTIVDEKYRKLIEENQPILEKVKAIQITHLSQIEMLERMKIDKKIVADYSLNITNDLSEKVLQDLGVKRFTLSPELDKKEIQQFCTGLERELVVYGRPCLMTSKYCPIGKNGDCQKACQKGNYELQDRKNFVFPVVADMVNCHAKIFHSKALQQSAKGLQMDFVRVDILHETKEEIEKIISRINF